ncbi:MAG: hypothetical protein FWC98_01335, partial [Bacteroidales bacterium]|nr:hypothetical protein [Bacteroidales bacterium]
MLVRKQIVGCCVLLFCALLLRGQELSSVVQLNSGEQIFNTIIYGNFENRPVSAGVSGNHSASDSVMSGNQNIH